MVARVTYSEAELIEAIRSRVNIDPALLALYKLYYQPIERYVLSNQGNEADAQDLMQEVMVSLVDLIQQNRYRGEASLRSLVFTLARNHWITMLRKRGSDSRRETIFEHERELLVADVSEYVLDREAQQAISAVFAKLGEACRKILTMYYYEDLSMKEILRQTEYANEAVLRNKKHRCLKTMTDYVQQTPGLFNLLREALGRTR